MSKIDELIERLCPDGVEYKALKSVAKIVGGRDYKEFGEGQIPVYGSGGIMTYVDTAAYEGPSVLLPRKGSISNIFYVDGPFWNVDTIFYTEIDESLISPRYFYHVMLNEHIEKLNTANAARPALTRKVLDAIRIPVPPMEVQEEIVRVLDSFAELEAELEARKRQYAYYRDRLLTFEERERERERVRWVTSGEIGEFHRGNGLQKKDFVERGLGCIHYGQIYTFYGLSASETKSYVSSEVGKKCAKAQRGDLIVATTSENSEDVCKAVAWLGDGEIAISGDSCVYRHSADPKYMAYFFQSRWFQCQKMKYITGTKVLRVSGGSMSKIKLALPALEVQREIVEVLDQFDALVSDISQGLPAEIEARRKQYTYYRDKLLNFKEKVA